MSKAKTKPNTRYEDHIYPLNMNGLEGRMLRLPSVSKRKNREILFVYGHHSNLERWQGLAQELARYGNVTMPDLPGFGGMDSFHKIGKQPTIDEFADYLAAFIKLRYKRKRVTIIGLSIGFAMVTRMLQRHPEMTKKVDLLVSVVGFAHHDDFVFSRRRQLLYKLIALIFARRPLDSLMRLAAFNPLILRLVYHRTYNGRQKFIGKNSQQFERAMSMEIRLWQSQDFRTWLKTSTQMFKLDNCNQRVNLPVWHVYAKEDRYFDVRLVEQHFRVIYNDYNGVKTNMSGHGPSVIATASEAAGMFPSKLKRLLK
jgi:pimeloyl-ACP methyl ester carboxylesterase